MGFFFFRFEQDDALITECMSLIQANELYKCIFNLTATCFSLHEPRNSHLYHDLKFPSLGFKKMTPAVSSPTFTILYFSGATAYTKRDSEQLTAPMQLAKLFDTIEAKYPGIKDAVLTRSMVTVNLEYVEMVDESEGDLKREIKPGDEVAIIPPVSSG
jgi:molybdopterin converting factor small subunit